MECYDLADSTCQALIPADRHWRSVGNTECEQAANGDETEEMRAHTVCADDSISERNVSRSIVSPYNRYRVEETHAEAASNRGSLVERSKNSPSVDKRESLTFKVVSNASALFKCPNITTRRRKRAFFRNATQNFSKYRFT